MGAVKALWQAERDARWQQFYDDFCFNECGGMHPSGGKHDDACEYANDMMDEEDAEQEPREPYVPSPEYLAWCAEVDAQLTRCEGDPLLKRKVA